jgi:hypothetical protein
VIRSTTVANGNLSSSVVVPDVQEDPRGNGEPTDDHDGAEGHHLLLRNVTVMEIFDYER